MRLRSRLLLCTMLAAAVSAGAPAFAQAQNIVPNPSFENGCSATPGDAPDSWTQAGGGTLTCSTTARTGSFGGLLSLDPNGGAFTTCVTQPLHGNYAASFAYNAGSGITGVSLDISFYPDADCQGFSVPESLFDPTLTSGSFELVSGTVTAPAGTDSVFFALGSGNCPGTTCSVIFDDVSFNAPTTAATFRTLAATATAKGVAVRWRTASEVDTLGFHVYREVNGKRVRVTPRLIAANGRGTYSFLDRKAPKAKTVRYWVQVVNLDGSHRWYGPARVLRT